MSCYRQGFPIKVPKNGLVTIFQANPLKGRVLVRPRGASKAIRVAQTLGAEGRP